MTKTAVIGSPIKHSLSPTIHNHWFVENKMNDYTYEKLEVELDNFNEAIRKITSTDKKLISCLGSLYNVGNILNKN